MNRFIARLLITVTLGFAGVFVSASTAKAQLFDWVYGYPYTAGYYPYGANYYGGYYGPWSGIYSASYRPVYTSAYYAPTGCCGVSSPCCSSSCCSSPCWSNTQCGYTYGNSGCSVAVACSDCCGSSCSGGCGVSTSPPGAKPTPAPDGKFQSRQNPYDDSQPPKSNPGANSKSGITNPPAPAPGFDGTGGTENSDPKAFKRESQPAGSGGTNGTGTDKANQPGGPLNLEQPTQGPTAPKTPATGDPPATKSDKENSTDVPKTFQETNKPVPPPANKGKAPVKEVPDEGSSTGGSKPAAGSDKEKPSDTKSKDNKDNSGPATTELQERPTWRLASAQALLARRGSQAQVPVPERLSTMPTRTTTAPWALRPEATGLVRN